jgi:Ca2+-binding RTX toxin-like protein
MARKIGTNGNNTISGTNFNDIIQGLGGNDILNGRGGNDSIDGGAGNDTITGGAGLDRLFGGVGKDTIFDDSNNSNIALGGDGNDVIGFRGGATGISIVSVANGGAGNDSVFSLNGNSKLYGGTGVDILFGGNGSDLMWGGAGQDQFLFDEGDGLYSNLRFNTFDDVILDFEDNIDTIDFGDVNNLNDFTGLDIISFNDAVHGFGTYIVYRSGGVFAGNVFVKGVSPAQLLNDIIV